MNQSPNPPTSTSKSNPSPRGPKELVDRYLQAVRFWLPRSQPQEDLTAELGEDLRSQIDAREAELGRALDAEEVSAILKRCGPPVVVAARLRPQMYLIGPTLFPIYLFVLKMVLLWILVPVFVFIIGPVNFASARGDWGLTLLHTFGSLWSGAFTAAGTITLIFVVLERTQAHLRLDQKWDPRSLPPLQKQDRGPSLLHTVCELSFGMIGVIWLLLLPHHPWMIFGSAGSFLRPAPIWHTFYAPILLLAFAGLLRSGLTLARPQWTWFPPTAQLVQTAFSLILLGFIVHAVDHAAGGSWPFVVLIESARNSPPLIRVAAIVNVSILISLPATALGLSIAAIMQTWQLLKHIRNRNASAQPLATMHVH